MKNWLQKLIANKKVRQQYGVDHTMSDKMLMKTFKKQNHGHVRVEKGFIGNFWAYSDVPVLMLTVPKDLRLEAYLYDKDGAVVQYNIFNNNDVNIGVLNIDK